MVPTVVSLFTTSIEWRDMSMFSNAAKYLKMRLRDAFTLLVEWGTVHSMNPQSSVLGRQWHHLLCLP